MKGGGDQYHRTVRRTLKSCPGAMLHCPTLSKSSLWVRLLAGAPRLQTPSSGELYPVTIGTNQTARTSERWLVSRRLL